MIHKMKAIWTNRLNDTLAEIEHTLRFLSHLGCNGFDCSEKSIQTLKAMGRETLEDIQADLGDCRRCPLSQHRNRIVFGKGDPNAKLMFVGEGPGYDEDQQGEPFVGAAGQLLTKIIQAIGLSRDHVYICNVVKCRPPGNRTPLPDEIEICLPFLERQIAAIKPAFICALGAVAAQALISPNMPISKLRGRFYDFLGIRVLPTYHPAYLLRNPDKKRDVWEDMKRLIPYIMRGEDVAEPQAS